jgi:hypothetical protein
MMQALGQLREDDGHRAVRFERHYPHWPGRTSSSVRFELSPDHGGTLLVLDHRGLPQDAAIAYAAGCHAYLDRLAAQFDGDVPDWDERFSEVFPKYRELAGAH